MCVSICRLLLYFSISTWCFVFFNCFIEAVPFLLEENQEIKDGTPPRDGTPWDYCGIAYNDVTIWFRPSRKIPKTN